MKFILNFLTTVVFSGLLSVAFTGDLAATAVIYPALEIMSLFVPKGVLGVNAYADTVLQEARAFIKDENNRKFQLRPNLTNIFALFERDREYTIPNLANIRQATTQATKATYLKKKDFTVGTSKSCTISGETSGSGIVTLSWQTASASVISNYKQFAGNDVALMRALANDLYNLEVSLWEDVDSTLLTYLDTNKSGVNNGSSGSFNATTDIMQIKNSEKNRFYNYVTADMRMNNYMPQYLETFNTFWTSEQQYYINQGAGNNVNTAFQFNGFDFFPSNLIDLTAENAAANNDYSSIHYIVPAGGVAILDWNDPLNREGRVSGNKSWGTYQSLLRPGITLDLYKVTDCADTSADGGGTQDYVEEWELSFNFALAKQPVPTADETPIYKYGVLEGDTYNT